MKRRRKWTTIIITRYIAISPGAGTQPGPSTVRQSADVILAVTSWYSGQWEEVQKDTTGRAVAANLVGASGDTMRIIGVYNVTSAWQLSLPATNREASNVEQAIINCIHAQAANADRLGLHLVVGGDLNSFVNADLDRWGPAVAGVRPGCLAKQMERLGMRDTFRERHLSLKAMSYYSNAGSGSRLDQIWSRGAQGTDVAVANLAIVWRWQHRIDHDPYIVDLLCHIPAPEQAPGPQETKPWRQLLRSMENPAELSMLKEITASIMEAHSRQFAQARASLQELRKHAPKPMCSFAHIAPWQAQDRSPSTQDRDTINWAADVVEGTRLSAIPWPPQGNQPRRVRTVAASVQRAIAALQGLRNDDKNRTTTG